VSYERLGRHGFDPSSWPRFSILANWRYEGEIAVFILAGWTGPTVPVDDASVLACTSPFRLKTRY
jgi:hypothetical protein